MRPPRAAWLAGPVTLLTLAVATLIHPTIVTAQTAPRLDLEAQTLFVDENPVEIVLRVIGAPEAARLRFTIHADRALTRAAVREHHRTPPSSGGMIADFECSLDGDCLGQATMTDGPDGIVTVTVDDLVGESLRRADGALSFVVQLVDGDTVLDQLATSLLVLDRDSPGRADPSVSVAFTSAIIAPLALQPDLGTSIDTDAVLDAARTLATHPGLPVTIDIRPETFDALADSAPDTLAALREIVDGRPLLRSPWVDLDEEAWRLVGESDLVVSQYALGVDTVEKVAGSSPTGIVRLDPDAGPDTLALLRSAGATAVLVADDQLPDAALAVDATRPFSVLDSNGVALTALRYDEALHETLDGSDPELAAYQAIAELALLAEEDDGRRGVVLDVDRIDTEVLSRLLDGIEADPSMEVSDLTDLLRGDSAGIDDAPLRAELVPEPAPDLSELAERLDAATVALFNVGRMVDPEIDLLEPAVGLLQAAVSTDLDASSADLYLARVNGEIRSFRTAVDIPAAERITLTDRRTDIPLTIVNSQPVVLQVELVLTAEKIRFPDGTRVPLVLQPGPNTITIPAETLASGDARVTATVVSPGGFFELGQGTVDIRSTAISGLGLLISIVALIVLGVWWVRTILRVRRNRHAATVSAEGES